MKKNDDLAREIQTLRERITRLSTASLRISASLDLDTVLHEISESARALTGARYCAIATIGETGEPVDLGFEPQTVPPRIGISDQKRVA